MAQQYDRDAVKEIWLLFENAEGRFPLYPGQRTVIEYGYTVGAVKWGQWFQRAVRLPTRQLVVRLDFPAALDPQVWGVETSLSAEEVPLRTPPARATGDGRVTFSWETSEPPLNTRYRLEWRFRRPPVPDPPAAAGPAGSNAAGGRPSGAAGGGAPVTPVEPGLRVTPVARVAPVSERMRALGIVQRSAELLRRPARPLVLPDDEAIASDIVARLVSTLDRVIEVHVFGKGVGLAAPQIGLSWAVAVVRPSTPGAEPVVLLNPRVVDHATESDQQYEGCLSFFDVRGLVPRPLGLQVEHTRWDGGRVITTFERGVARLVAHEIDHLEGRLYVDRMAPDDPLVPVEAYRETGQDWRYG